MIYADEILICGRGRRPRAISRTKLRREMTLQKKSLERQPDVAPFLSGRNEVADRPTAVLDLLPVRYPSKMCENIWGFTWSRVILLRSDT